MATFSLHHCPPDFDKHRLHGDLVNNDERSSHASDIDLYEVTAIKVAAVPNIPVFATSYDMAAHYYAIWWMTHRAGDMPDIEIRKRNPAWPGLNVPLLHEALNRNQAGIGRFDAETGWTILSPGHEDLGAI